MEEKSLVERVKVECEGVECVNKFELEYYLTNEADGVYGVEIIKKQDNAEEIKHLGDIVRSKENTMKIIESLAINQVTPTTLEDVVDDYLGVYA